MQYKKTYDEESVQAIKIFASTAGAAGFTLLLLFLLRTIYVIYHKNAMSLLIVGLPQVLFIATFNKKLTNRWKVG